MKKHYLYFMFFRSDYRIGNQNVCRIGNEKGVFFDIIPHLGAMVYQICLLDNQGDPESILQQDTEEELLSNPLFRGRILFPFNDRIPSGRYTFEGKEYQLPLNNAEDGSAIHGLVYNKPFTEQGCAFYPDRGEISFSFFIQKEDWECYPFSVELTVRYIISESEFSVHYTIENHGYEMAPVALGWHPYFTFKKPVDSLSLLAGNGEYVAVDRDLNPTGEILSARGCENDFSESALIGNQDLDLAYVKREKGESLLSDGNHQLKLYFDPLFFPYVQLFIPPGRQSIALEPITSATNAFNIPRLGRIDLPGGEKRSGRVTIHLS
jgi:aldose 1-epimerase